MIRTAKRQDVPAMLEIYTPYVLTTTATFEYEAPSLTEFYRRFDTFTAQFPWILWEEEGKILGYAYASPPYSRTAYAWCAEPTIYLRPEARGRGIGPKLYTVLEAVLKKQGYQVLYALVCEENGHSVHFHGQMGYIDRAFFPDCGFKFGKWLGLHWMEKRLSDVIIPNGFPTPWGEIVQNAETFVHFLADLSLS